jgi:hypothetical protein
LRVGTGFRQARLREASASEPLQKCRNRISCHVLLYTAHVWRRHVDCVGCLRVPVPRPTDDAQVRADSTSSAERAQSSPRPPRALPHIVAVVGREPWSNPQGSLFFSRVGGDSTSAAKGISLMADRWRQSPSLALARATPATARALFFWACPQSLPIN